MTPEERSLAWSLRNLATAHLPALAFQAACAAHVFEFLELEGPCDRLTLARGCRLGAEAAAYLLEALTALHLLERAGDCYRNSHTASRMLVPGSPFCQLDVIAQNRLTVEGLRRWDAALGERKEGARQADDPNRRLDALHATALPAAGPVADRLDPGPGERVLDLGGGAGTFLLELRRRRPCLQAVLLERPELVSPLRDRLAGEGIEVRAGDFRRSELGAGYTLVLLSHVVNYLDHEELAPVLQRASACLAPGGRLAVHDILLGGRRDALLMEALFALRLMAENQGQGHTLEAVRSAMTEAGLTRLREHDLDPEPAHLLIGQRE